MDRSDAEEQYSQKEPGSLSGPPHYKPNQKDLPGRDPLSSKTYPLPAWARGYRLYLIIFDVIIFLNSLVFILFAFFPGEFTTANPNKMIPWMLVFAGLFLMVALIPYLLSNLLYGILWWVKIRGKGFLASKISSLFIVSVPALISSIIFLLYLPAVFAGN